MIYHNPSRDRYRSFTHGNPMSGAQGCPGMRRYVVFGVVDDILFQTVRIHQNDLCDVTGDTRALRFPVHITFRGPFRTGSTILPILFSTVNRCCESRFAFEITVRGPILVDPDLCWFEVQTPAPGFSCCLDIHEDLERLLSPFVMDDDVPVRHKGENYRPHITVGWGALPGVGENTFAGPVILTGTIKNISVGCYPDAWPAMGDVKVIKSFPLRRS